MPRGAGRPGGEYAGGARPGIMKTVRPTDAATSPLPARTGERARWRTREASIALVLPALAALLTTAVFAVRGLGDAARNWPVTYELSSSDNGVLFQLASDLFAGRPLDWSFSPQTYTFPELPISLAAYALALGNVYAYYVIVAALNQALLVGVLAALVRLLFPAASRRAWMLRTALASAPLVILPLVANNSLYLFHLAPTYYFGLYLLAFARPIAVLTRRRGVRVAVLVAYALTGASNPLLVAMTLPSVAVSLIGLFLRDGRRGLTTRVAVWFGATLAVTIALRAVLSPLAATDPTSYISATRALGRVQAIRATLLDGFNQGLDPMLLALSLGATGVCLVAAVIALRRFVARAPLRVNAGMDASGSGPAGSGAAGAGAAEAGPAGSGVAGSSDAPRSVALVYLTTLPVLGAVAMYLIMAVHQYYLWLFIVGGIIVAALVLPRQRVLTPLAAGLAVVLVAALGVTTAQAVGNPRAVSYFGYRAPITQCLDDSLPAGSVGYATFSDARRYALPSASGIRLIAVGDTMGPNYWLANRATARTEVGSFVLLNPHTDETGFTPAAVLEAFGAPARTVACDTEGTELWVYDPASRERIAEFYRTHAG